MTNCCVFVLGEVGRSPRMQYHALSLSQLDHIDHVDLIGLGGSDPHPSVLENSKISLVYIQEKWWNWIPARSNKLLFLLFAPIKVFIQILCIFFTLLFIKKPKYMLVQTPPAIPTLFLVHLVCFLRGITLILDWHNYGWSLLELSLGKNLITRFIKNIEMMSGRMATSLHFCVSKEMQTDLKKWGINAIVLYDRSPSIFCDLDVNEKHNMYTKISLVQESETEQKTPFSILDLVTNKCIQRKDRPGLIVSSTSWTKDEDFGILLDAIKLLDAQVEQFPNLEFIITGKGDEKERYEAEFTKMRLKKCRIQTRWLASEDYPKLLASADLGICLHYSSSGLDLPMKIVDMFGVGLPVCAIHYKTLKELVKDGYGMIFHDSQELAQQIISLFAKFPKECSALDAMKKELKEFQSYRWNDEWNAKAARIFD